MIPFEISVQGLNEILMSSEKSRKALYLNTLLLSCCCFLNFTFLIIFILISPYRSVAVLTECMREPKTSESFRNRQMALHHALPLGSYLLKPVQRVLKYHLLLQVSDIFKDIKTLALKFLKF